MCHLRHYSVYFLLFLEGIMQALSKAFADVHLTTVSLHVPKGTTNLDCLELGSVTHLTIEEPVDSLKLKWLSTKIGEVIVLDVTVSMIRNIDFSWFSACTKLRSIALRSLGVRSFECVLGFTDEVKRPNLESITVTHAKLGDKFLASLNGLPLTHVSFENSRSNSYFPSSELISFLKNTPTLRDLNVRGSSWNVVNDLRNIHARFPYITLTPQLPTLRENFNAVLTSKKDLDHSYSLATLDKNA